MALCHWFSQAMGHGDQGFNNSRDLWAVMRWVQGFRGSWSCFEGSCSLGIGALTFNYSGLGLGFWRVAVGFLGVEFLFEAVPSGQC